MRVYYSKKIIGVYVFMRNTLERVREIRAKLPTTKKKNCVRDC